MSMSYAAGMAGDDIINRYADAPAGRDSIGPALPFILFALAWLAAAITFGFPGIIIPALAAVVAMFWVLIMLTLGKVEVS